MRRTLYSLPPYIKRSLMWGGGPRSGGRSLRNFEFILASSSRPLPQSATLTAPSLREPSFVHSSAYINKVPTNLLIGLWELFVDVFSPLRVSRQAICFFVIFTAFAVNVFMPTKLVYQSKSSLLSAQFCVIIVKTDLKQILKNFFDQ